MPSRRLVELPIPEEVPLPPPEVGEGPEMGPIPEDRRIPRSMKPQVGGSWDARGCMAVIHGRGLAPGWPCVAGWRMDMPMPAWRAPLSPCLCVLWAVVCAWHVAHTHTPPLQESYNEDDHSEQGPPKPPPPRTATRPTVSQGAGPRRASLIAEDPDTHVRVSRRQSLANINKQLKEHKKSSCTLL